MARVAIMGAAAGFAFGASLIMSLVDREDEGSISSFAKLVFLCGLVLVVLTALTVVQEAS